MLSVKTYLVEGMSCDHCVNAVKSEVSKVKSVSTVEVDLDSKVVTVTGGEFQDRDVIAAVDAAGYDASVL